MAETDAPRPQGILLHTCCAWCLLDVIEEFRRDYGRVVVGFFNPNVHLRAEFRKRLKSARMLCERLGLEFVADEEYGLAAFLGGLYNGQLPVVGGPVVGVTENREPTTDNRRRRCAYCYELRMRRTARAAQERGLAAFSTTLLASPYQFQEELRAAGRLAAAETGAAFDGRELVRLHDTGRERLPGGLLLHRQRYCGCVFSEAEPAREPRRD